MAQKGTNKGSSKIGLTRPDVALKIVNMVTSETVDFKDIRREIAQDHGLIIRTLKLANSASYGLPRRIESLDRAVVLLGARTIGNTALAASMEATFSNFPSEVHLINGRDLHQHCLAVAKASEMICRYANLTQISGMIFVAALLHDIGMINQAWKNPLQFDNWLQYCTDNGSFNTSKEIEITGMDHAAEGMRICVEWSIPANICHTIGYHHRPFESKEAPLAAAVIALAESIVGYAFHSKDHKEILEEEEITHLLARIRISDDEWPPLKEKVQEVIGKMDEYHE